MEVFQVTAVEKQSGLTLGGAKSFGAWLDIKPKRLSLQQLEACAREGGTRNKNLCFWRPCMAINVSVQHNSGSLPNTILLTLCYYHRGTRLNAMNRSCLGSCDAQKVWMR